MSRDLDGLTGRQRSAHIASRAAADARAKWSAERRAEVEERQRATKGANSAAREALAQKLPAIAAPQVVPKVRVDSVAALTPLQRGVYHSQVSRGVSKEHALIVAQGHGRKS